MKKYLKAICIVILGIFTFQQYGFTLSQEVYPNYKIRDNWDEIINSLTDLEAYKNTSKEVPVELFSKLNSNFKKVFDYFPQNADYKVIYRQCLLSTDGLSQKFSYDDFLKFRDICFDPINKIIKQIDSNFTVNAVIKTKISSGSVPLTVTFDGRNSSDPSNETIPSNNYFWYFKDNSGKDRLIGQGPIVTYTFNDAGNYKVHLTVRSAVSKEKGIFDGEATAGITVDPKSAIVSVYVGGKKLMDDYITKIGTEQAKRGILIDGTGTNPTGGRKILSHRWDIKGVDNSFTYSRTNDGNPKSFVLELRDKGEYSLSLTIKDNEGNEFTKQYSFAISDPVASIKTKPETDGDTSTKYYFDASSSYSVQSRIKSFKWNVYDPNGKIIDTFESKNFTRRFLNPGNYAVKLTVVDDLGQSSDDYSKFYVDSTPPVPQFTMRSVSRRKNPSQFLLDGSASYDIDQMNGSDELTYKWKFSDPGSMKIEKSLDNGKKAYLTFNEIGKYKITLEITDKRGKMSELTKEIEIKSSLRPEIYTNKFSVLWGESIRLNVKANKTISHYSWDFGDGTKGDTEKSYIDHIYTKVGVYTVKLTASTPSGDENEVSYNVYVGQKGQPIAAYEVKQSQDVVISPDDICVVKDGKNTYDYNAYLVDRKEKITIDTSMSVNSRGDSKGLKFYFQPQNDETISKTPFTYQFDEVGCQYLDLSVEDSNESKVAKTRIRFKVQNALPNLKNIALTYPQYGNESGVGLTASKDQNKEVFEKEYDPLIVKVSAAGATDSDGFVSHYIWYYYKSDDPDRLLEVKVTPSNVPYAIFSLGRVPGEFAFGVKVVDNDGGEGVSEDILGKGPVVFFRAEGSPDIPLVTLNVNNPNPKVGEEVTFNVAAKILSNRSDFASERVIKYDFDGDGTYDLTTKKAEIKHTYSTPGTYKPKVKVVYRGYGGVAYCEALDVQQGLKAMVLTETYDKMILVRDISFGDINKRDFCMDIKKCETNKSYNVSDKSYFSFEYPDYGRQIGKFSISDKYGNEESDKIVANLSKPKKTGDVNVVSIPSTESKDGNFSIDVGNNLDNSVLFYVASDAKDCYIDFDISEDSNGDGNPEGDKDGKCNVLNYHTYNPVNSSAISRIYYTDGEDKKVSKDITINFLDIGDDVPEQYKTIYNDLTKIIGGISADKDENLRYLKTLLVNLRKVLGQEAERDSLIIQINEWLETNGQENTSDIDAKTVTKIKDILNQLADGSVKAAMTLNDYEVAKADILTYIPEAAKSQVNEYFDKIDFASGDMNVIKDSLQKILDIAKSQYDQKNLDDTDLNVILNDICGIMKFYNIESPTCGTAVKAPEQTQGSVWGTILKVIGIVLLIGLVIFIGIILLFAVKAKRQQKQEKGMGLKENGAGKGPGNPGDTGNSSNSSAQSPVKPKIVKKEDKNMNL